MDLINTRRYPLNDLASNKATALIERCRTTLGRDGICALDGFLQPEVVEAIMEQSRRLIPLGTRQQGTLTPYFGKGEGMYPPEHSANFHMPRDYLFVHGGLIDFHGK